MYIFFYLKIRSLGKFVHCCIDIPELQQTTAQEPDESQKKKHSILVKKIFPNLLPGNGELAERRGQLQVGLV